MTKTFSGSPVSRRTVFILADGSFVVQWDENRVQELLSGRYRNYSDQDFGHSVTDYELNQLQAAGRVEHYNDQYVWLFSLPESGRFPSEREYQGPARVRSYYLNTTLSEDRLTEVSDALRNLALSGSFLVRARGGLVAVLGKNGAPFPHLKDAERAQKLLVSKAPELFEHTAIAFVETSEYVHRLRAEPAWGTVDLPTVVDSQSDTTVTSGKRVLVVSSNEEEQTAVQQLFATMEMTVYAAASAAEGLQLLEDHDPDLLIMDLQLPDMHAWEMLAKIKEIGAYDSTPKILIAEHNATGDDQAFALTVGKVDTYLAKPMSMAQLRLNVWLTLKNRQDDTS